MFLSQVVGTGLLCMSSVSDEENLATQIFQVPALPSTNTRRKTPLGIHFIYLGNKETCCIFKTCYIDSVLCSNKRLLIS